MANQKPLSTKLTAARENDVTGVTKQWDFAACRAGAGCRMHVCFAGRTRPRNTLSRSHLQPKQGLGFRRRGFMAVVRPSRPICPILDCATALSIVPMLIAVVRIAMAHRMT